MSVLFVWIKYLRLGLWVFNVMLILFFLNSSMSFLLSSTCLVVQVKRIMWNRFQNLCDDFV